MRRAALLAAGGIAAGYAALEAFRRARETALGGQVVLVTGGSRGLGMLVAREFARQRCRVAVCARDAAELDNARRLLAQEGLEIHTLQCDITDRAQAGTLIRDVRDQFGKLDILVNNAGAIQVGPLAAMTLADFEDAMKVMFWGVLYPTMAALEHMLPRKSGHIVNVTSIGGKVGVPHLLPYTCAKFAAVGFSEGLRAELKGQGVRVTTIVPGLMRTGSFVNAYFKGEHAREYRWFSLGAAVPGISMSAERAARQIVKATRRREAERVLSLPANLLARFHGLFPGLTSDLMALANDVVLPAAEGPNESRRGMEIHREQRSAVGGALRRAGLASAERFNEYPGPLQTRA